MTYFAHTLRYLASFFLDKWPEKGDADENAKVDHTEYLHRHGQL